MIRAKKGENRVEQTQRVFVDLKNNTKDKIKILILGVVFLINLLEGDQVELTTQIEDSLS